MKTFEELKTEKIGEETIIRKDVENTPFQIISIPAKKEHFGVMGKYRITEKYNELDRVKNELTTITWNRIIQVGILLHETLNQQK